MNPLSPDRADPAFYDRPFPWLAIMVTAFVLGFGAGIWTYQRWAALAGQ